MSIKGKLISGFGALLIIISAFGMYVHVSISTFDKVSKETSVRYEQLVDLEIVKNINTSLILEAMDLLVKKDYGVVEEEYISNTNRLFKEMFDLEAELLGDADNKEKRALINEFMADYRGFEKTIKEELPSMVKNIDNVDPAKFDEMDKFIDEFGDEVSEDIEQLKAMIEKDLHLAEVHLIEYEKEFDMLVILTVILSLVLGLAIATYIIRNITKSIYSFQEGLLGFFKYINKESSDAVLLNDTSNDEIGAMAKVINKNIKKSKSLIEQDLELIKDVKGIVNTVKNGVLHKRIEHSTQNESLEELKELFNSMLDELTENICGDTNKIQNGIEEFQKLNFMHRIPNPTGKTSQGLNALAEIINKMLIENKQIGLTLGHSSEVLLENVNTLNRISNESAAAIEETAAALDEITNNIVHNTENVIKMGSYAKELNISANDGESLAQQTTNAMNEINEQVTAISEAISVIDQISFQTNILSLNAAVEAATAGEAGKGFAVVAQEVRNLASKSAEAANEIKEIVETATKKANDGKIIASQMIAGYTGLNENITSTITLIANVENSSKEQKMGIEQINNAVNALDQQTQENAAISNKTQDIANQTNGIAHEVLRSANEKEFIGKSEVKAKLTYEEGAESIIHTIDNPTQETKTHKKPVNKKSYENEEYNDKWESF